MSLFSWFFWQHACLKLCETLSEAVFGIESTLFLISCQTPSQRSGNLCMLKILTGKLLNTRPSGHVLAFGPQHQTQPCMVHLEAAQDRLFHVIGRGACFGVHPGSVTVLSSLDHVRAEPVWKTGDTHFVFPACFLVCRRNICVFAGR